MICCESSFTLIQKERALIRPSLTPALGQYLDLKKKKFWNMSDGWASYFDCGAKMRSLCLDLHSWSLSDQRMCEIILWTIKCETVAWMILDSNKKATRKKALMSMGRRRSKRTTRAKMNLPLIKELQEEIRSRWWSCGC